MDNINVLVLSTQRNTFYVNITNRPVNYGQLWIYVSKKRFMKLEGFLESVEEAKLKKVLEERKTAKYFNCLESFLSYCK